MICENGLEKAAPGSLEYATLLSRKAVVLDIQGKTESAVGLFHEAIALQQQLNDSTGLSYSYNNLGISCFYMFRYDEAIRYYRLSAEIDSLQKDYTGWAGTMINIAVIYSNGSEPEKAQEIYDNLLSRLKEINEDHLIAVIYSNSAKLHVLKKEYQEALEKCEKARPILLEDSNPASIMTLEVVSSNTYLGLKDFPNALKAAKRGLSYDPEEQYTERRMHLYECLSHAYYALQNIEKGNEYNTHYQFLRDSLFTIETQEQLSEIQTKYDLAEKERELFDTQLREAEYRNEANEKAKIASENAAQRNLFIAIAAIAGIIGLGLFIIVRIRQSEQRILRTELEANELLVRQKENFLHEIHHRVKNNLQMVSSMLAIQAGEVADLTTKEQLAASKNRIETMSLIHERLYQKTEEETIDIETYLKELLHQINAAYPIDNQVNMNWEIQKLELHLDTVIPLALIINELITNSFKYAFSNENKPEIGIRIYETAATLHLEYWDNGPGNDQHSTGFGTRLISSLSRQLKGKWNKEVKSNGFFHNFSFGKYKKSA